MYGHSYVIDSFCVLTAPRNYHQQQENQLQRPRDNTAVPVIAEYLEKTAKQSLQHRRAEIRQPEAPGTATPRSVK